MWAAHERGDGGPNKVFGHHWLILIRFALPPHLHAANLTIMQSSTHHLTMADSAATQHDGSGLEATFATQIDDSLTWECVQWLKSITRLPILIKVCVVMGTLLFVYVCTCVLVYSECTYCP